jgi:hypothetical protein
MIGNRLQDGADRLTNVIARCPNDPREAHFGKRCEEIERKMTLKPEADSDGELHGQL